MRILDIPLNELVMNELFRDVSTGYGGIVYKIRMNEIVGGCGIEIGILRRSYV